MAYSPMIQQYLKVKEENPDCILFFRLGDFYEMFFEDAETCSKILEIALTSKECGGGEKAPMCGVPFHSVDAYVNKLIESGYKVAVCEQLTDPKESKGIVERGVVRIVTPGTLIGDELQFEKKNNYVLCAHRDGFGYYISFCDVSTGAFFYNSFSGKNGFNSMLREIIGYEPTELLLEENGPLKGSIKLNINKSYIIADDFNSYQKIFTDRLNGDKNAQKGCITVCGMLFSYLLATQKNNLDHIKAAVCVIDSDYMEIDANAKKHLELFETLTKEKKGSLLHLLDRTETAMGGRLLRSWLNKPLLDLEKINARQSAVSAVIDNPYISSLLSESLSNVYDIERIISKLAYKTINARDCLSLKKSLYQLPAIKKAAKQLSGSYIAKIESSLDTMEDVYDLLERAINPEAPITIKDGDIIRPEFNEDLKELYDISKNSKDVLTKLENAEREETGIKNLKLGYNKVFGYYFEVTKSYYDKVPYRYSRKQTLANCERFITDELKELESKITGADEKRIKLEYSLFEGVREALLQQISRFQTVADCVSELDCINALGIVAKDYGYVRPNITKDGELKIEKGRHPIVERAVKDSFVANDTYLNTEKERFAVITGPNMAGKSTYMRQIALITILAHIGSFVPAANASVPLTSKIFTRIGALDNLSQGKSTFMVEMSELADIIENADKNSLIILDEVGRGTSTIDGVSIALAAVHYITSKIGAKTLFATHYHQLSDLEGKIDGVVNYKIAVSEEGDKVVFLHTIKRGGTDKSFGIYVAKLAGLPADFIALANGIMKSQSEENFNTDYDVNSAEIEAASENQAAARGFNRIKDELDSADLNNITPMEALNMLFSLKQIIEEEKINYVN